MSRYRVNFAQGVAYNVSGTGAQLTISGINFPQVSGTYMPIVLNPGYFGATNTSGPEIVYVTSVNSSGTVATLSARAQEGSSLASGAVVPWVAGPVVADFDVSNLTSTGTLSLNNGISASGSTTFNSGATVTSGITVNGNSTFNNNLTVIGNETISGTVTAGGGTFGGTSIPAGTSLLTLNGNAGTPSAINLANGTNLPAASIVGTVANATNATTASSLLDHGGVGTGLIIQYGVVNDTTNSYGNISFNFPSSFPNACLSIFMENQNNGSGGMYVNSIVSASKTGAVMSQWVGNTSSFIPRNAVLISVQYIAIGY